MRANGVPESHITGDASDAEKFAMWCKTLETAIGSPLYHWSHMELKQYFGWDQPVTSSNAAMIYAHCNEQIGADDFNVHNLLKRSRVEWLATTDDPTDTLKHHTKIKYDNVPGLARVLPTFRPGLLLEPGGINISNMKSLKEALIKRIAFFHEMGGRASDHALVNTFWREAEESEVEAIFQKAIAGKPISQIEDEAYKTSLFITLAAEYTKYQWGMELHFAAIRNLNTKMFETAGADTGFDAVGSGINAEKLAEFLDGLHKKGILPKTIIFSLNPADNAIIGSVIGCFQGDEVRGKIQQGAAWWFNDTQRGMLEQIQSIADLSAVGNILGMLTDSRSFLSYARHEYYRRILCNWIGNLVENGEYPADMEFLGQLVEDICYNNVANYFNFAI
jgi:glucuronate isomerase